MIRMRWRFAALPPFIAACLFSCVSLSGYGTIRQDSRAAESFKAHEINPQYKYYIIGPGSEPDAIMGIDRQYALETAIWQEVNPAPEQMKAWVDRMTLEGGSLHTLFGSVILGPDGSQMGLWFSRWRRGVVKVTPDKKVTVSPDKGSLIKPSFLQPHS